MTERPKIENAPGLKWTRRKNGWQARWQARSDILKRGFRPGMATLWQGSVLTDEERARISAACRDRQAEMLAWSREAKPDHSQFHDAGKGRVYFVADGIAVKIGFTTYFDERLSQLQSANSTELIVLAVIPAKQEMEAMIHKRFKHLRVRGEWFAYSAELRDYVEELKHSVRQPTGY